MVQKSWLEKSRVGMSFSLLERWHFNPGHFNHKFLNCGVEKLWLKSLGLKSPGLKCPLTSYRDDISTPDFSTQEFLTMKFSIPDFSTMNFWTPIKLMVEKSGVEMSRVGAWGWKVRGWDVLQSHNRLWMTRNTWVKYLFVFFPHWLFLAEPLLFSENPYLSNICSVIGALLVYVNLLNMLNETKKVEMEKS